VSARCLAARLKLDYSLVKRIVRGLIAWRILERARGGLQFQPDAGRWDPLGIAHARARGSVQPPLSSRRDLITPPVPVAPLGRVDVGEAIWTCGYAHGSILLQRKDRVLRFGPILQHGYVAALSPYDIPTPEDLLLDLRTAPCGSGSPVFRVATGEVIAML